MAIDLLTPLPPPPLPTDPESLFDTKAGNTLLAQKVLVDEMNANVIPQINLAVEEVQGAGESAEQAAAAAAEAKFYAEIAEAVGGVNFPMLHAVAISF